MEHSHTDSDPYWLSPIVAAASAMAEAKEDTDQHPLHLVPVAPQSTRVRRAAKRIASSSIDSLLHLLVHSGDAIAGPWRGPATLARAIRDVRRREPIVEALIDRLEALPSSEPDLIQWWWSEKSSTRPGPSDEPGVARAWSTSPRHAFWTTSPSSAGLADALLGAWDFDPNDVAIWAVTFSTWARILVINSAEDWSSLAARFPLETDVSERSSWEFPGPNRSHLIDQLLSLPDQRAAAPKRLRFIEPDWTAVSKEFDAVHLTWKGFVLAEGRLSLLDTETSTMMRGWSSERSLLLTSSLASVEPLGIKPGIGLDIRGWDFVADRSRLERDRSILTDMTHSAPSRGRPQRSS
jgi:hypothetical protein